MILRFLRVGHLTFQGKSKNFDIFPHEKQTCLHRTPGCKQCKVVDQVGDARNPKILPLWASDPVEDGVIRLINGRK